MVNGQSIVISFEKSPITVWCPNQGLLQRNCFEKPGEISFCLLFDAQTAAFRKGEKPDDALFKDFPLLYCINTERPDFDDLWFSYCSLITSLSETLPPIYT